MPLVLIAGLWLLLFWNNARFLPFHVGFDSDEHLKYINYIQEHRALPLPNEGWEMYQPPLYYLIAAASLSACKLSINDSTSILVLRLIGAFLGIAQLVFVFLSLRLLFSARTALVGLLLAAFLPMHLYLAHYVTNEILAAALATVTLYLCLRLLKSNAPRVSQFAWLGLALGAAMLAKATAILLLPVVCGAIASKLAYARAPITTLLRSLGLLLAICLAVCGWHYTRIWLKFGTPLLGNWDVVSGFTWWQDPGYHTAADYLRFGRSLLHPLFSGFAGFADGIYSTLWGDALCGGASSLTCRLEPTAVGGRLFVGAHSYGGDSHRHGGRGRSIYSKTFQRIVPITRFRCGNRARPGFHDAKSSLLRSSKSVLRLVGSHATLFLWCAGLGNGDPRARTAAICSWYAYLDLGDE